ncbi:hypothetical protein Salat_0127100 [Sesamum alatum]|uniref:Uncharacterized protein n=1 Tax=Sesamum alatum TaxID=300844 RepID=A0AAE2CXD8_9LAMI|nr:hypothetical protein Salat_0127100 [Sesamum alatum]
MAGETLRGFMARFNNEMLDVHDLRIKVVTRILTHSVEKRPFASALARNPPKTMEELSEITEQYIREEEMLAMKEDWAELQKLHRERGRPQHRENPSPGAYQGQKESGTMMVEIVHLEARFDSKTDPETQKGQGEKASEGKRKEGQAQEKVS